MLGKEIDWHPSPPVIVDLDFHGNTTTPGFFPLSTTPHQRLVYKGGGCPKMWMDQCAPTPPPPATVTALHTTRHMG